MATTSQVYEYLQGTGVVVPDTSDILNEVQTEYQDVFGTDIILDPSTPQGVLMTAEALARTAVIQNNAQLANLINPNIAGGVALDAIMALTGQQRTVATNTVVSGVTIAGVAGTIIPVNAQAQTINGDIFEVQQQVTIGTNGTVTANFAAAQEGPIGCGVGQLTTIVSSILGWETVNNSSAGVLGQNTQSDQGARALRNNTMAFQGVSLALAITSALYNVSGVTSLQFLENYESAPMGMLIKINGGLTLAGEVFGMTTTSGSGINNSIVVDTDAMNFAISDQTIPAPNPWPQAAYATTGNISLYGLGTQTYGDWPTMLTAGQIILAVAQNVPAQNGLWVAASGSWTRQSYNTSGNTILPSNEGISLKRNSVWACVAGGNENAIAAALLENKSSGAGWNGGVTVATVEPASGQSYNVQFDLPTPVPVVIKIYSPNGNAEAITQSVLDYANGSVEVTGTNGVTSTLPGFVVGADASPFEIAAAIVAENPGTFITNVELSLTGTINYQPDIIPIALNQQATTQNSYITVITG